MLEHHVPARRPSVLLIITDQQRYDAVGYIDNAVLTPNLDLLSVESVICTNSFVQSPQCQPSRAAILTGKYPSTLKVWWNDMPLNPAERTIANILRSNEYATGYFGKMHIDGVGSPNDVANHFGFDHSFLSSDWGKMAKSNPDHKQRIREARAEFYEPMSSHGWYGRLSGREFHHDEVIVDKAIEFIQSCENEYFCTVGFHGPHPPYSSPPPFSEMYDPALFDGPSDAFTYQNKKMSVDDWRHLKSQYYGCISWIDDNIGRLLRSVDNNTIVIFTSDHGDILGDHNLFSKGMFAYDGNVRVPLLMKLPGVRPIVYDHIVQSVDILPTICSFLDIKYPAVQGKNLHRAFKNGSRVNDLAFSMIGIKPRLKMIRSVEYKYWWCDNHEYLFDLRQDPSELVNIAHIDQNAASEMRLKLIKTLIESEYPI